MGSDLSYEDMMEERKLSEVYIAEIVNEDIYIDSPVWIMQLTSKVEGLAYYKRTLWIDKNKFVPLKENLYAKSGILLKTTTFTNIKKIDSRWFPMKMNYKDMLKDGKGTDFVILDITFNSKSNHAQKLSLNIKGPKEVLSSDFDENPEVEIIDKEAVIMNVDSNREVNLEIFLDVNKGYISAEKNKDNENKSVGQIMLDATYSPVKRVSFNVENSRIGQDTEFDKLILDIETNGTVSPDDAAALAARILQDQLKPFINFEEPTEDERKKLQSSNEPQFNKNLLKN